MKGCTLAWVKAHIGTEGNEAAASQARSREHRQKSASNKNTNPFACCYNALGDIIMASSGRIGGLNNPCPGAENVWPGIVNADGPPTASKEGTL